VLTQLHNVFTPVTSCGFIQITISRVRVYIMAVCIQLKTAGYIDIIRCYRVKIKIMSHKPNIHTL